MLPRGRAAVCVLVHNTAGDAQAEDLPITDVRRAEAELLEVA